MTKAQAATQQLGALLDLSNWLYNRTIICDPGITREIERRIAVLRAEIRTLTAAERANLAGGGEIKARSEPRRATP